MGQDSLINIEKTEDRLFVDIKENNNCDTYLLQEVLNTYISDSLALNTFFSKIYAFDPNVLELNFLQEVINISIPSANSFNINNFESLERFYYNLRLRITSFMEEHQELLLMRSHINYNRGKMKLVYSSLAEVIKIHESRIFYSNNSLFEKGTYQSNNSFKLAHKAYIYSLRHYSVDDIRFKILAKNEIYNKYRNYDEYFAYEIINTKLAKAGYQALEIPNKNESRTASDIDAYRKRQKKKKEENNENYDWKKKE